MQAAYRLEAAARVHVFDGHDIPWQETTEPGVYASGLAVEPARLWNKVSARLRRLDELFRRLAALEKRVGDDAGHP